MIEPSTRKQATPKQKRNAVIVLAALFFFIVFANAFLGTTEKAKDESSKQTILTGSNVVTNQGYAGCRRIEDTDKFTALLAANDSTAAMSFLDQADCRLIEAGARGEVEEDPIRIAAILALIAVMLFKAGLNVLREYERPVVFNLGRLRRIQGPGLVLLVPFLQRMVCVDRASR